MKFEREPELVPIYSEFIKDLQNLLSQINNGKKLVTPENPEWNRILGWFTCFHLKLTEILEAKNLWISQELLAQLVQFNAEIAIKLSTSEPDLDKYIPEVERAKGLIKKLIVEFEVMRMRHQISSK